MNQKNQWLALVAIIIFILLRWVGINAVLPPHIHTLLNPVTILVVLPLLLSIVLAHTNIAQRNLHTLWKSFLGFLALESVLVFTLTRQLSDYTDSTQTLIATSLAAPTQAIVMTGMFMLGVILYKKFT